MSNKAYIVLANGQVFEGKSFGATGCITGEVVFTTGMTGYLEALTDPSFYGQIILQTFPLIGNYGIIPEDAEIVLCNKEKGVWRANKIIVKNPQIITDEMVIELYKRTTLTNKILAQCLQTLLWRNRIEVSKFIINDRVNKENVDEFIKIHILWPHLRIC